MSTATPSENPVIVLLEGDRITQLLSCNNAGELYALTSYGFILKRVFVQETNSFSWFQVPAPLDIALARQLQEEPNNAS